MDVRTFFMFDRRNSTSTMFQMQGDIYFDFQINKRLRIFYDRGMYSGFEMFALARVLPANGYVKVGKFMPAYGTRTDDHNAFIRGGPYGGGPFTAQFVSLAGQGYVTGLRFGERSEDTGVEFGLSPGPFTVQAAVFNGTPGSGVTGVAGTKFKTVALRGDGMLKLDDVNLMAGASYFRSPSPVSTETFAGAFGAVSVLERFTLNAEVDQVSVSIGGKTLKGMILWNEFHATLIPGVDLKLGYEFYDPDVNLKNGSFTRIVVGAEAFLLPGVEVRPQYRLNREEPVEVQNDEVQLMLHFFF
jgi:hypothetical protein